MNQFKFKKLINNPLISYNKYDHLGNIRKKFHNFINIVKTCYIYN